MVEVDARYSFDTANTILQANRIVQLYEEHNILRERVLIKIAATWEGIQAAKQLQEQGINCNITLLFSHCQAVASAQAKAYLISPFVGRILDWYKEHFPDKDYEQDDPGVKFVKNIYNYYKQHQVETIIMGASFRNTHQIEDLAGCDKLTISPPLLEKLTNQKKRLSRKIDLKKEKVKDWQEIEEKDFRWQLNEDSMATEKLAEGIYLFSKDVEKLEELIRSRLKELNKLCSTIDLAKIEIRTRTKGSQITSTNYKIIASNSPFSSSS